MSLIGIIGDTQLPAVHPGYLDFCLDMFDEWGGPDNFVHQGDLADMHNQAFHDKHPDMPGPRGEYLETLELVNEWHMYLPKVTVLNSNHDSRAQRVAAKYGLVDEMLTPLHVLWKVPGWTWVDNHIQDGTMFVHGDGAGGGEHPAWNYLKKINDFSVSLGHFHTKAGIKWRMGLLSRRFGMDVGCGVDRLHPAMQYDRKNPIKPVMACAVLKDGIPYHEVMPCGPGETYHRSRFA